MEWYEATKRRQVEKDKIKEAEDSSHEAIDYPPNTTTGTCSVASQTNLTAIKMDSLENDLQSRTEELAEMCAKGYPTENDLQNCEKTLRFYTGFSSFHVFYQSFSWYLWPSLMEER